MSETKDTRLRPSDAQRRDAAAQRLHDYIAVTVAAAPPLTPEQRDRLALLLRGGAGDDAT